MSNTALWDKLGKTDPAHTKGFKRSGGFSGTAIKPMWAYKRMTEEFGACGEGWGINEPAFQVVPGPEGEVLVYCTVSVWHGKRDQVVYGVGGDKVVGKNKYGLATDDEAFKKAFTDGITNALKMIGVGADVHMGLFEDSKYLDTLHEEFSKDAKEPKRQPKQDRNSTIADTMIEVASAAETVDDLKAWKEKQWPEIKALDEVNRRRVTAALTDIYNALVKAETLRAG